MNRRSFLASVAAAVLGAVTRVYGLAGALPSVTTASVVAYSAYSFSAMPIRMVDSMEVIELGGVSLERVRAAQARMTSGNFVTQEELERELASGTARPDAQRDHEGADPQDQHPLDHVISTDP